MKEISNYTGEWHALVIKAQPSYTKVINRSIMFFQWDQEKIERQHENVNLFCLFIPMSYAQLHYQKRIIGASISLTNFQAIYRRARVSITVRVFCYRWVTLMSYAQLHYQRRIIGASISLIDFQALYRRGRAPKKGVSRHENDQMPSVNCAQLLLLLK